MNPVQQRFEGHLQSGNHPLTSYVGGINRDFSPVLRVNSLFDSFDLTRGCLEDQNRMEAEGKFIRAFCFWGGKNVCAALRLHDRQQPSRHSSSNLPARRTLPTASVAEAYEQIERDLNDAIENLPEENGIYATKYAASLLAQVHFLKMEFEQSATLATEVISVTASSNRKRTAHLCVCDLWIHEFRICFWNLQHLVDE